MIPHFEQAPIALGPPVRAVAAEGGDGDDGTGNECATNAQTDVRDSKNPAGPAFAVRSGAWMSFVSAVR
ncbi:DUF397 domain-containing protein [Embleya sp. NPDC059237]|uniref:DUF397 domain-containing protein n=1 Tax=Embleya sp. NPDC059237 TaxID=3346784 RepID=UPI00367C1476